MESVKGGMGGVTSKISVCDGAGEDGADCAADGRSVRGLVSEVDAGAKCDLHYTEAHECTKSDFRTPINLKISQEDSWEGGTDEVRDD